MVGPAPRDVHRPFTGAFAPDPRPLRVRPRPEVLLGCGPPHPVRDQDAYVTVVDHSGGFGGSVGADSTCDPFRVQTEQSISVDERARQLAWNVCEFESAPDSYSQRVGQRELTDSEVAEVDRKLAALEVGTAEAMCGPDANFMTLDVQTDAGTTRYISGSGCAYQDGNTRMLASGISGLYMQLDALSQQ